MSELVAKIIEGDFSPNANQLPEIVVYWDINFGGANFRTNLNITYVGDTWNDQISSFIVVSGRWQFYRDINLTTPVGPVFGPGYYPWVENYGIQNDSISSFQCIGF